MYNLSAFKSYDIRGIWQKEIDEEFASIFGYALGKYISSIFTKPRILIVSDVRMANIPMMDNMLIGLANSGINFVDVYGTDDRFPNYKYGICSTPMGYYMGMGDYDITIIASASHNTKEYVGLKIIKIDGSYFKTTDLKNIFEEAEKNIKNQIDKNIQANTNDVTKTLKPKLDKLLNHIGAQISSLPKIPNFAIDLGHGAATHYEKDFLGRIFGDKIDMLYTHPNGDFPAHETDTSRFANYHQLISHIYNKGFDFGIMFDGDVDRLGLVSRSGRIAKGDIILAIVSKGVLEDIYQNMGDNLTNKPIIYQEVFCGNIVREVVNQYDGELRITRVGRGAFVNQVKSEGAILAGEVSGHLLFGDLGMIEMPLLVIYYVLRELGKYDNRDAMMEVYDRYIGSQVLHFVTDQKDEILDKIQQSYSDYEIISIDGIRVQGPNWRFCIRKSGTEPILKLALEAGDQASFDNILTRIRQDLTNYGCHEE